MSPIKPANSPLLPSVSSTSTPKPGSPVSPTNPTVITSPTASTTHQGTGKPSHILTSHLGSDEEVSDEDNKRLAIIRERQEQALAVRGYLDKHLLEKSKKSPVAAKPTGWQGLKTKWKKWRGDYFPTVFKNPNVQNMFTNEAKAHLAAILKDPTVEDQNHLENLDQELNTVVLFRLLEEKDDRASIRRLVIEKYLHHFGLTHRRDLLDKNRFIIDVLKTGTQEIKVELLSKPEQQGSYETDVALFDSRFSEKQKRKEEEQSQLTDLEKHILERDQLLMGIREAMENYPDEAVATFVFGMDDQVSEEYEISKWDMVLKQLMPKESVRIIASIQNQDGKPNVSRLKSLVAAVMNRYEDDIFTESRMISILSKLPLSIERKKSLWRITLDGLLEALLKDPDTEKIGLKLLHRSHYVGTRSDKSVRFYRAYELIKKPQDWYDSLVEVLNYSKLRKADLAYDIADFISEEEANVLGSFSKIKEFYHIGWRVFQDNANSRNTPHKNFEAVLKENIQKISVEIREYLVFEICGIIDYDYENSNEEFLGKGEPLPKDEIKKLVKFLKVIHPHIYGSAHTLSEGVIHHYDDPDFWNSQKIRINKNSVDGLKKLLKDKDHVTARSALEALIEMKADLSGMDLSRFKLFGYDFTDIVISNSTAHQIIDDEGGISGAIIKFADFSYRELDGIDFSNCGLDHAIFDGAVLKNCNFEGVTAIESSFKNCRSENVNFENAMIHMSDFGKSRWEKNSSFTLVKASHVNFTDVVFSEDTELSSAEFGGSNFTNADFTGTKLYDVKFVSLDPTKTEEMEDSQAVAILDGANFQNADLRMLSLEKLDLSTVNLSGTDCRFFNELEIRSIFTDAEVRTTDSSILRVSSVKRGVDKVYLTLKNNLKILTQLLRDSNSSNQFKAIKLGIGGLKFLQENGVTDLSTLEFSGEDENRFLEFQKKLQDKKQSFSSGGDPYEFATPYIDLKEIVFSKFNFTDTKLNQLVFHDVYFADSQLTRTDFSESAFLDCHFHSDFENINLDQTYFLGTLLDGDLTKQDLSKAVFVDCNFKEAKLSAENLRQLLENEKNEKIKLSKEQFLICVEYNMPLQNIVLEGVTIVDLDLSHQKFLKVKFSECNFEKCSFDYAKFENCIFEKPYFINCALNRSTFDFSSSSTMMYENPMIFSDCELRDATFISGMDMSSRMVSPLAFERCDLRTANFEGFYFPKYQEVKSVIKGGIGIFEDQNTMFRDCDLRDISYNRSRATTLSGNNHETHFLRFFLGRSNHVSEIIIEDYLNYCRQVGKQAVINDVDFSGLHLRNIDFTGVELNNIDFSGSDLKSADFTESKINSNCLFHNANLSFADFSFADISGLNLHEQTEQLSEAYFNGTKQVSDELLEALADYRVSIGTELLKHYIEELNHKTVKGFKLIGEYADLTLNDVIFEDIQMEKASFKDVIFNNVKLQDTTSSSFTSFYLCRFLGDVSTFPFLISTPKYHDCDFRSAQLTIDQIRYLQEYGRRSKINVEQVLLCIEKNIPLNNFDLTGLEFTDLNLSNADFRGAIIGMSTVFTRCQFDFSRFDEEMGLGIATVKECDFRKAYLTKKQSFGIVQNGCGCKINRDQLLMGMEGVREFVHPRDMHSRYFPCVSDVDVRDLDLSEIDFSNLTFQETIFDGANLRKTKWKNVKLVNVSFKKTNLEKSKFKSALMRSVDFTGANLRKVVFDKISNELKENDIKWDNANLSRVQFVGSLYMMPEHFEKLFSASELFQLDLRDAQSIPAYFLLSLQNTRAKLSEVQLLSMISAYSETFLVGASVGGSLIPIQGYDLSGLNLSAGDMGFGIQLNDLDLTDSDLESSVLLGQEIKHTLFNHTNMRGTVLSSAAFSYCIFTNSPMTGAIQDEFTVFEAPFVLNGQAISKEDSQRTTFDEDYKDYSKVYIDPEWYEWMRANLWVDQFLLKEITKRGNV